MNGLSMHLEAVTPVPPPSGRSHAGRSRVDGRRAAAGRVTCRAAAHPGTRMQ